MRNDKNQASEDVNELSDILTFDLVIGTLALSNYRSFNVGGLYYSFYKLQEKYPKVLSGVDFTISGEINCQSNRLEGLFFQLKVWGILGIEFAADAFYTMDEYTRAVLIKELVPPKHLKKFKKIASDLDKFIEEYTASCRRDMVKT